MFEFRIGEDIVIALDALEGNVSAVTGVTARMCRVRKFNQDLTEQDFAGGIELVVKPRDESGDVPAGWDVALPASAQSGLKPGRYLVDAKMITSDNIDITGQSAQIELTRGAIA